MVKSRSVLFARAAVLAGACGCANATGEILP
jgi:hypothetical protein